MDFRKQFVVLIVILVATLGSVALAQEQGTQEEEGLSQEVKERVEERKSEIQELLERPELAREREERPLEEKVYVRGEPVDFEEYGQPPIIREGRTLVPLRTISDYLGADVEWDGEEEKVTVELEGTVIELIIGETEVVVDGETHFIDVPGKITEENRTVVPLRFISDILGESVDYWEETGEIDVGLELITPPDDVVNEFWKLYSRGEIQEAEKMVLGDDVIDGMKELDAILDEGEEDEKIFASFDIEAYDYELKDDGEIAIVAIEFTKPDFAAVVDEYFVEAYRKAEEMLAEGYSEEEIIREFEAAAEEITAKAFQEVDTVTHQEEVELHLEDEEWKIAFWHLNKTQESWNELMEQIEEY